MSIEDESLEKELIVCPVCRSTNTQVTQKILDIPHFSQFWLFHLKCADCGFKHNDMLNLEVKEPTRYVYHAENKDDYTSKIVRSANGTIRIPILGALIEPGPSADGFINNIEGILHEIRNKAKFLLRTAETRDEINKITSYIEKVDEYIEKNLPLDLIIEDPFGNSLIIPFDEDKMETYTLSKKESEDLKTSFLIFSGDNEQ